MSSLFIAFCFTKNITWNDKCISGTALYRINHNVNKFSEITFKGFTASSESMVVPFEKNSIVLLIGRYAYKDAEYVTLVQSVSISFSEGDYVLTPEDLLSLSPLLIYSAAVVTDSYIPDNQGGRESFMMARQLYNGVTNSRNMESKVILFYKNENNRYSAMKNNLKKTVLSVIGRLKIGSKKFPHILASNIEWTYVSNEPLPSSTTINAKGISEIEFDEDLNGIEEKYATLTSQVPQKRQNTKYNLNLHNSNNKRSSNKTTSINLVDVISQVQKGTSFVKTAYKGQSLSTNNFASTSQNTSQYIPSCATLVEDKENAALISDNNLIDLVEVRIQEVMPEIKEKHRKHPIQRKNNHFVIFSLGLIKTAYLS
ncbi:hypothetical protein C2G38_2029369 [Gigaspora rosea]|uniref:Uncharacterized protein n=1 Tax=Gigaspora rosea TaxID=44941 RepID=A0A397VXZ0_9GLOM|nr:hypothetical protein C2G38_2029369 [Gigaspora rosea]